MSTRPLPPPVVAPDDPGPWSVVSHVRQTLAHRPDRRRGADALGPADRLAAASAGAAGRSAARRPGGRRPARSA